MFVFLKMQYSSSDKKLQPFIRKEFEKVALSQAGKKFAAAGAPTAAPLLARVRRWRRPAALASVQARWAILAGQ